MPPGMTMPRPGGFLILFSLRDDRRIVLAALSYANSGTLRQASARLRGDAMVVLAAVATNGVYELRDASEALQERSACLAAIRAQREVRRRFIALVVVGGSELIRSRLRAAAPRRAKRRRGCSCLLPLLTEVPELVQSIAELVGVPFGPSLVPFGPSLALLRDAEKKLQVSHPRPDYTILDKRKRDGRVQVRPSCLYRSLTWPTLRPSATPGRMPAPLIACPFAPPTSRSRHF